jgi:hypothetical protein
MTEDPAAETASMRRHRATLAILFIAEGLFYLLCTGFVWLILLSLIGGGYRFDGMNSQALLILSGATALGGLLPLFAACTLLRRHAWAKGSVLAACLGVLMLAAVATSVIMQQHLSRNRLIAILVQNGISLALSLYGFWFVSRFRHKVRLPSA